MAREKFTIVNISDCMEGKVEGFAEPDLKRAIAVFSSIDPHVEFSAKCCVLRADRAIAMEACKLG